MAGASSGRAVLNRGSAESGTLSERSPSLPSRRGSAWLPDAEPKVVSRTVDTDADEARRAEAIRERPRVERHEDVTVMALAGALVVVGVGGDTSTGRRDVAETRPQAREFA